MKKLLFSIVISLLMFSSAKASHILGGQITWTCLTTGDYIFELVVFRDCDGATFQFVPQTLDIHGSPAPRGANGAIVRSIVMNPDSVKWLQAKNGDTSPDCDQGHPNDPPSCANGDKGTIQQFFFRSAPVRLDGVPPSTGWRFVWEAPCCRPNDVENLVTGGSMILRAEMFPTRTNQNTYPCIDSSPQFGALPTNLVCRGNVFTYNHTAVDRDLDSLLYSWDRTWNRPGANPSPVTYDPRYSPTNPTPDQTFSPINIPSTLDPITGIIKTAVYSDVGTGPKSYLTVIRVDAIRDGRVISSTYRELPYYFYDCDLLQSGTQNNVPSIFIDGQPAEGLIEDIVAGDTVEIPFQARDPDFTGYGVGLQYVTVTPRGLMFSTDLQDDSLCQTSFIEPCATLRNKGPYLNTAGEWELGGYAGVITELFWATQCKHIKTATTGVPGANFGIYNFVMRVQDDHCPLPAINYPTITVRVRDPLPLTEPIMKGASVGLDGRLTYSWVPPMDSSNAFFRYISEVSNPAKNQNPTIWSTLGTPTRYQQSFRSGGYQFHYNGANNKPDILNKIPNRDWYVRMHTESGCRQDVKSQNSEVVEVIQVNATPSGAGTNFEPLNSKVTLNWNRPKPLNAATYSYFEYESPTHFYIWQNDSIEQSGQYLGGEAIESNWYLRGDTNATTYNLTTTTCNGKVGFRIEARDTVITWKEGTAPRQNTYDTLTFSTFSIIDTMFMESLGQIPIPRFDTLEVMPNGDVFYRVDRANAGTTGSFRIVDSIPNGIATQIDSFGIQSDSIVNSGASALTTIRNYYLEAIDECNLSNIRQSPLYSTFIPQGRLDSCGGYFRIALDQPDGFRTGVAGFRIYVDKNSNDGSGPYVQRASVTDLTQDSVDILVDRNTSYWIKVVAFDQFNDVIISHVFMPATNFRTEEVVPAPPIYCTYVEDDGSVTLTFRPLGPNNAENQAFGTVDSTGNWLAYEFEYRKDGGAWQTFVGSDTVLKADTFVNINIDAFNGQYEFRSRSLSGCLGTEYSDYSDEISVINLSATQLTPLSEKKAELVWNANGATNAGDYTYFKTFDKNAANFVAPIAGVIGGSLTSFIDSDPNNQGQDCELVSPTYHLEIDHITGCTSRSTMAQVDLIDLAEVPTQLVDFVTVNPSTGQVEIYWSIDSGGVHVVNLIQQTDPSNPNGFSPIDTDIPWAQKQYVIPLSIKDPFDTTYTFTVQAADTCGGGADDDFDLFDYHTTMDVDVNWVECDSTNYLEWNPYTDFRDSSTVTYEVYVGENLRGPFTLVQNSETEDTTYAHKVTEGGKRYYYYVKATDGGNRFSSTSNVDSDSAFYQDEPLYKYMYNASVLPGNDIEVSFVKDTMIEQGGYSLYRGVNQDAMLPIARFDGSTVFKDDFVSYIDPAVQSDDYSYFYQVVIENLCGNAIDTTNLARTIHLTVEADNEALTNTLRWNEYQKWDSAVAYYNIYRGYNGAGAEELYATVKPKANILDPNMFVDDVYDNALVVGQFCYKVEAVQGPVTTDFPNSLTSATSTSNEVCVIQKPLFYVPNAFAPDGVNKVFAPQGQFFDFTLFEMVIYNRWGEEIYRTRDINKGWTGAVDGEIAQQGSYVYTIRFVDAEGQEHRRKGTVTLIR